MQKIRWVPSSGALDHFFDDELVPASRGVQEEMLRNIEPFPTTTDLVPYNAGYLSGWVVERYQIDLVAAAQEARQEMDAEWSAFAPRKSPATRIAICKSRADYSGQTFKHILVPIWLLTYNYGARNFQVVINGYTGTIAGKYPKSWIKITWPFWAGWPPPACCSSSPTTIDRRRTVRARDKFSFLALQCGERIEERGLIFSDDPDPFITLRRRRRKNSVTGRDGSSHDFGFLIVFGTVHLNAATVHGVCSTRPFWVGLVLVRIQGVLGQPISPRRARFQASANIRIQGQSAKCSIPF